MNIIRLLIKYEILIYSCWLMNLIEFFFMVFGWVVRIGRFNKFLDFLLFYLYKFFSS